MTMFESISQEEQVLFDMYQELRYNFSHPDKEGYVFLTNLEKGESLPIEFAQEMGFICPEFNIREPQIPDNLYYQNNGVLPEIMVKKNRDTLLRITESIWVRERFRKR